ncbi:MAG TPA: DUF481 domain-containing protein [Flavobacteriales bacterium]|nr:DUF481 domain-containing protein [Flavobacteriales bacterium]HMR28164.1 DUF481 domain-containing protein [Flavobacteriales bacterium]
MRVRCVIGFLALSIMGRAQLSEVDTLRWQYRVSATGNWLRGNIEQFMLLGTAEIAHVKERWGFKSAITYQYGTFFYRQTLGEGIWRNFVYADPRARLYPYLMLWYQQSYQRGIDHRTQVGPGLTYVLLRKNAQLLKLSATATYETSTFRSSTYRERPDLTDPLIETYRLTGRLYGEHRIMKGLMRLQYEAWVQPSLTDADNLRAHVDAALSIPLKKGFALRQAVNWSYESVVQQRNTYEDLVWTFGVSFEGRSKAH